MKRTSIAGITFSVFLLALPLVSAKTDGSPQKAEDEFSETIEGDVKEKLSIDKPPPSIDLDTQEIVDSGTPRTEDVLRETKPIPNEEDFEHYARLNSHQIIRPWMPLIPEPPLVTFRPGLSDVAVKRWEFRVMDQSGEVIKTIRRKGVPPRQIAWDGLTERGQYITVGTLYSYQFVTFDEHDNAHTFPGEPFQLDALMYKQKGRIYIEFANQRLFLDDQAVFRPSLKGFWERAIDVIREHSSQPLAVEVFA